MLALFWLSLAMLLYTFLGYPLILWLTAKLLPARSAPGITASSAELPRVSIVLSVYNEEQVIAAKIDNFLSLDYPADRLELVVVSDRSTDRTEEIIRTAACSRVRLYVQPERRGKTFNLNHGVEMANGDLVVFTDANSMFSPDALRRLVAPLSDPSIGLVSGRSIYVDAQRQGEIAGGTYRAYEEWLKALESRVSSIVGADGAIYALRKELYEPLPPEVINDFVHTIEVVQKGFRAVSEQFAICTEEVDEGHRDEFARQVRMMAQSWCIYFSYIGGLLRHGHLVYAWALTSHKLLRWMVLPNLLLLLGGNLALFGDNALYSSFVVGQTVFWVAVAVGRFFEGGIVKMPYLLVSIHAAAVVGLLRWLTGASYATWMPRKN